MKRIELLFAIFFLSLCCSAQDIEVKKFEPLDKDQTAVTSPRKDINGNTCGLVKVALKEAGAEFEGNVMGDVQFTGSEYLVYLPNGTKRLGIKHPDYLPTTIVFADYGTKRVASSTTYELKVKTNKKKAKVDNSKKGMAVFNIKPSNAMLMIDGQIADGSGGAYTLSLPQGTHYYTVKLKDFSLNNQMVKVDKNAKTINVDLTEFFAKVDVACKTADAEIVVNGEQKGVGHWSSMVAPGKYTIEVSKDGCHSQTRQIELRDNDTLAVDFIALKTITGSLCVDYEPAGADVLLNGKKVGVTPLELKELPVGDYHMEICKEYYVKEFAHIKIREDQEWKESGTLKISHYGRLFQEAEDGEVFDLATYLWRGAIGGARAAHYSCSVDTFSVPLDPVKAVKLLRKSGMEVNEIAKCLILGWMEDDLPHFDNSISDEKLSLSVAKMEVEKYLEGDDSKYGTMISQYGNYPSFQTLAWHYFYGIGCERDIEEAKKLIRWTCTKDGEYMYPALKKLIKDMRLDSELKYNPDLNETEKYL
jgi:hypothetical protein